MVVIIVGWIILAVFVVILLLVLFTPFGLAVDYTGGALKVSARVMCFDLPVYPKPAKKAKKPAAKREKKPSKAKKEPEKAEKKPKKPLLTREMIPDVLRLALRTLSRFRRKLTVNRFLLHVTVAGAEPYGAVMTYGGINYALATLGSAAGHAFNVRSSDVQTGIDFSAETYTVEAGVTVTIDLARILAVACAAGVGFIKIKRRADKAAKAGVEERKDKDG